MRFDPRRGWIYDRDEVQRWGEQMIAHIMQATEDRRAIAHLDFEPEGE